MIAVGTCGFSYKDWIGPVYPHGTKASEMLRRYAGLFSIVEIDSTYYGLPTPQTVAGWARRTPEGFRFTAKLPRLGTHVDRATLGIVHEDVRTFRRVLAPLVERGKFACALMQFPTSFRPSDDALHHIGALRETLHDIALVAEFRHREWQTNATLDFLRELGIGLVAVDEPQFAELPRPMSDATSSLAYVRFHGRNYETWWTGDNTTRYDYAYRDDELGPWVERLVDLAAHRDVREVLAFFNNHRRGHAVRDARTFEAMLAGRFPPGTLREIVALDAAESEPPELRLF